MSPRGGTPLLCADSCDVAVTVVTHSVIFNRSKRPRPSLPAVCVIRAALGHPSLLVISALWPAQSYAWTFPAKPESVMTSIRLLSCGYWVVGRFQGSLRVLDAAAIFLIVEINSMSVLGESDPSCADSVERLEIRGR